MGGLIGRVRDYVQLNGISYTLRRAGEKFRDQYLREYDRLYRRVRATPADLEEQRQRAWKETPLVSILVPVYNTNPRMLRELAESFLAQTYPHWEAVLLDGASTRADTADMLREIAGLDPRFRVIFSGENLHISGNSNAALAHARGEWIALCDHDDLYTPDALYWVMDAVEREQPDFLYSDEDKVSEDGRVYFAAHFKPDYCPDNLRSGNYICHLMVMRRSLMEAAGGFRSAFDGSQDHDLALRCMEHTARVTHIPRVLYHWRSVGSSMSHQNLMRCVDAARRAVEEHINRVGPGGTVTLESNCLRIHYRLPEGKRASLIVLDSGDDAQLNRCLAALKRTDWPETELLVLSNRQGLPGRTVPRGGLGRFAALNLGAAQASGDYLVFVDSSVAVEDAAWLKELLMLAQREDVAGAIPALFDGRGRMLHAGYALGMDRVASCRQQGLPRTAGGWHGLEHTAHNVGAVSAVCLAVRRERFLPFDEGYASDLGSVEWSLRVRAQGGWFAFTPFSRATAPQGAPVLLDGQAHPEEEARLTAAYGPLYDPCYSPLFSRRKANFQLNLDEKGRNVF